VEVLSPSRVSAGLTSPREQAKAKGFPDLPVELMVMIFKDLDPIASLCLGLTGKAYYSIHKSFDDKIASSDLYRSLATLPLYLKHWTPRELVYEELQGFTVKADGDLSCNDFNELGGVLGDFDQESEALDKKPESINKIERQGLRPAQPSDTDIGSTWWVLGPWCGLGHNAMLYRESRKPERLSFSIEIAQITGREDW
jgi:hypothetical protein